MYAENRFTPRQVWFFDDDSPIKAPGAQKSLIQNLRPIGGRQYNNTLRAIKPIHFSKKLIECLLALIVRRKLIITAFSDGVDLVDEDDARRVFLCILK